MSELFLKLPPPRLAIESSLTIAFALAVTLHAFPLIAAEPPGDTIELGFDIIDCGHPEPDGDPPEATLRLDDEPATTEHPWIRRQRELAILGIAEPPDEVTALSPAARLPAATLDHGELYLEPVDCWGCTWGYEVWRVRQLPALAAALRPARLRVAYRAPYTRGALHPSSIALALQRARPALEHCHAAPSLTLGGRIDGEVELELALEIDGNGHPEVWVSEDGELGSCVARVLTGLRFPGAPGATHVGVSLRYGTTDTSSAVFVR